MKLSIAMMVKNESKYLGKCLEALQPLMKSVESELIIVDTGSEDNTVEIAKRYTDKVYFHTWNNHFSDMRNITIGYATGEWIFIVDGDEILNQYEQLVSFFNGKESSQFNTAIIRIHNITNEDKEEENYSILWAPRIFKNDGEFRFEGAVHNQPIYKKPVIQLDALLVHYGYLSTDKELMERKFKRTSTILKSELEKNPENVYYLYQLSSSYSMYKDYENALKYILEAIEVIKKNNLDLKQNFYVFNQCMITYYNLHMYKETEVACLECMKIRESYLDVHYIAGIAQFNLGKHTEAINNFEKYLKILDDMHNGKAKGDLTTTLYTTLGKVEDAYVDLFRLYVLVEQLDNALLYALKLTKKDYIQSNLENIVKVFVYLAKFQELKNYYCDIIEKLLPESINKFYLILENQRKHITPEQFAVFCDTFKDVEGNYGLLCKARLEYAKDGPADENVLSAILNFNFNGKYDYYADFILLWMKDKRPISQIISDLWEQDINIFFEYLMKHHPNLAKVVYRYLKNLPQTQTVDDLRLGKTLARYTLMIGNINEDEILDVYLSTQNWFFPRLVDITPFFKP